MANHPSAVKRHRQSQKRATRNRAVRSGVRTTVKKVRLAVEASDRESAQAAMKAAQVELDKAVSKGVLHRKNASRRISRLARHVASLT